MQPRQSDESERRGIDAHAYSLSERRARATFTKLYARDTRRQNGERTFGSKEEVVMAHPVLFGLLGAFVISPLGACAVAGGTRTAAVVVRRRFRGGPIDLGAPDVERAAVASVVAWRRWQTVAAPWRRRRGAVVKAPARRRGRLARAQSAAARTVRRRRGQGEGEARRRSWPRRSRIIAREPFEREALEFLVGKGELADDLEHLHFSLTPEQRAKLRAVASA